MAKNSAANLLTSVDSLFTTQAERDIAVQPRIEDIPIDRIDDFPNHPFKVRLDDDMVEIAESIKQHGVLVLFSVGTGSLEGVRCGEGEPQRIPIRAIQK